MTEDLLAAVRAYDVAAKALQAAEAKHYGKPSRERTSEDWLDFFAARRNEESACRDVLEAAQQWAAHYG